MCCEECSIAGIAHHLPELLSINPVNAELIIVILLVLPVNVSDRRTCCPRPPSVSPIWLPLLVYLLLLLIVHGYEVVLNGFFLLIVLIHEYVIGSAVPMHRCPIPTLVLHHHLWRPLSIHSPMLLRALQGF